MVMLLLTACASPIDSARVEPATATLHAAPTLAPLETPPVSATATPVITASRIFIGSWSPASDMLAYWTFTAEEVAVDYTYPPGTLHFLNARTGQVCESPFQVGYGYFSNPIAWLPDGKVFILTGDQVIQGAPCGDDFIPLTELFPEPILSVATSSPDHSLFLLNSQQRYWFYEPSTQSVRSIDESVGGARPGYSWSPNSSRLAISAALDAPGLEATTSVVDVETGRIEDVIQWRYRDAEGSFAGPTWLSEDQFLIHETTDQGPLLVTLGQGAVQVVPELFGVSFVPTSTVSLRATAAVVTGTRTYHILLSGVGEVANFPPSRLYHSESGEVEELPFKPESEFSPDGRSMIMSDSTEGAVRLRAVEPLGSEARLLLTQSGNPLPLTWSPDGTKVAFSSPTGVPVFSSLDGDQGGFWETGGYSTFPGPWSPDGKSLAVRGYLPDGRGEALFVIRVP
ncbi:MAG TPA: hypothetical protein VJG32_18905 [Anaerolineae bacterium]|nr:hypothetical protein [Anaerolineae bacterium]